MKTSVETIDPVKVRLTVEVEPDRVKKAFDDAAKEIAKSVSLPGFRPGKAPRRLLEQRMGKGAIAQQAMEDSLTRYYVEALEEAELDAVAMPDIDPETLTFDESEGCRFEATVEIRPEFDPPDHEGIDVTFPEWDVKDDDVDAQLAQMRERFAEVDPVERPASDRDYVTLDLTVAVDGEELEDAAVEDAMYEVGTGGVTPKLDEEVVGKSAGDTFTYTDTLPDDYPEHGGKEAEFTVTVKDVREKTLPDLDDDFATTASEFDTIEELRRDIRDSLLRRRVIEARHEVRGRILEAYLAKIDIPLPPSLVEGEQDQRRHQLEHQAEQYGMEPEQLLQMQGTSVEEFEENLAKQATANVKAQLVLQALAEELGLTVSPEDVDREILRHAQNQNMSPQEVAQIISQQGSVNALVGDILRRKAIDAIADAAFVEGAPPQDVLIDLGIEADPDAADGDGLELAGDETAEELIDEAVELATAEEASEDTSEGTSEGTSEDTSEGTSEGTSDDASAGEADEEE